MLEVFHYTLGWLRYSLISAVHMAVGKSVTGWEQLIRSHSSARFCFELSGNSN